MKSLISNLRGWLGNHRPATKEVLLVFGPPEGWQVKDAYLLFQTEPAFRDSVRETDRLSREAGGSGILPFFEEDRPANAALPPEDSLLVGMAAQLGLLDRWLDRGLSPSAALGGGWGELTALCAVGAISRAQAVRWLSDILRAARQLDPMAALVLPETTLDTLPAELPCPVFPSAILPPRGLSVLCAPDDRPRLEQALTRGGINWQRPRQETCLPFHTPLAAGLRPALSAAMGHVVPGPVGIDYYTCSSGDLVSAHMPPPDHLMEDMISTPVRLDKVLPVLRMKSWHTIVHCHSGTPTSSDLVRACMQQVPATSHWYGAGDATTGKIRPLRRPAPTRVVPEKDSFLAFVDKFDILSPACASALPAIHKFLRSQGDLHFLPQSNCWLVLGYELATQVMQDTQTFSNHMYRDEEPFLLGADPPDHTHMRAVVQPRFAPKAIKEAADAVDRDVRRLLESMRNRPGFDIALDFSIPTAQSALRRFLGLADATYREIQDLMPRNIYEKESKAAVIEFFTGHMMERPADSSGRSMENYLLHAVQAGTIRLEQAIGMMVLFWDAGIYTTSLHLTNLVYELFTRPAIARQLQENPDLTSDFIGECLRLYPPGIQVMRVTKRDVSLGGKTIPAGSMVAVGMLAANRDPAVFPQADEMVLRRPARRDFVFGGGVHFCPGHHLAKREADAVVHTFLPILDRLELDPRHPPQRLDRLGFQGMTSLPVRWR